MKKGKGSRAGVNAMGGHENPPTLQIKLILIAICTTRK
jgi:hypothetical protein